MPRRVTDSSIEGGIFGGPSAAEVKMNEAQPAWLKVTGTESGGIFGAPVNAAVTSHPGRGTKSSIEGGIFGGESAYQAPPAHVTPRLPIEKAASGTFQPEATHATPRMPVDTAVMPDVNAAGAGMATVKSVSLSLAWNENAAPQMQAPLSARFNPNVSSIQGGIFGGDSYASRPMSARRDPNASSIQGGIFG